MVLYSLNLVCGLVLLLVSLASANVPLNCHTCEGIGCLRTSKVKTQECIDPLDICVTIFDQFNVVRKGCSMEISPALRRHCETPGSIRCHKCNSNLCNNIGRADNLCIECNSSSDSKCANDAGNIAATRCAAPSAPNAYCFVEYDGSVTKRGCATAVKEQIACLNNPKCMLCMPGDVRGCNSVNFNPGTPKSFWIE